MTRIEGVDVKEPPVIAKAKSVEAAAVVVEDAAVAGTWLPPEDKPEPQKPQISADKKRGFGGAFIAGIGLLAFSIACIYRGSEQ
jgi:hypothetical protein